MIFEVILERKLDVVFERLSDSVEADGYEIRVDSLSDVDISLLGQLREKIQKPVIFTVRRKDQGGFWAKSESLREKLICQLAELKPDFFDLEHDVSPDLIGYIQNHCPIIGSYHNFESTPDLDSIYCSMKDKGFSYYKMATFAKTTNDCLRLLLFLQKQQKKNILGISMGEKGSPSRVLGKVYGSCWTYASSGPQKGLFGQIPMRDLQEIYHFSDLNRDTEVFGLIGDPVEQSIGHFWHNQQFESQDKNAVYLKFQVSESELGEFLALSRLLNFQGFSVTMPLKKAVAKDLNSPLAACNTLYAKDGRFHSVDTDGPAVVQLLQRHGSLSHKKALVLGAGGSALSVIEALINESVEVFCWSRKATEFPKTQYCSMEQISTIHFDYIIHATSVGMYPNEQASLLTKEQISRGSIVVDLVYHPEKTQLLKEAKKKNCICIYGKEVFFEQAKLQQNYWNKEVKPLSLSR